MKYEIVITKNARKLIISQTKAQQQRLLSAIGKLPDNGDIKLLVGHVDVYRLRVGDYRIIYTKNDDVLKIIVINAGSRGQVRQLRKSNVETLNGNMWNRVKLAVCLSFIVNGIYKSNQGKPSKLWAKEANGH